MSLDTVALAPGGCGMSVSALDRDNCQPNSALPAPYIFPGSPLPPITSAANSIAPLLGRPLTPWERVTREVLAEHGDLWERLAKL